MIGLTMLKHAAKHVNLETYPKIAIEMDNNSDAKGYAGGITESLNMLKVNPKCFALIPANGVTSKGLDHPTEFRLLQPSLKS